MFLYFKNTMSNWFETVLTGVTDLPHRIYRDIEELKKDFTEGALHPGDLKPALSTGLNKILQVCF